MACHALIYDSVELFSICYTQFMKTRSPTRAIFITGASGVGKTTVVKKLKDIGYPVAFASDVTHFVDETGLEAARPWRVDDRDWMKSHDWVFDRVALTNFKASSGSDLAFVESVTSDMDKY